MPQIQCEFVRIPAAALLAAGQAILIAAGVPADDAALVASSLVEANLRGIDSHGIARLPHYLNRIRAGSVNARPALAFERLGPAIGRVDGDHGLGQVVMHRATAEAIELARAAGAGWVSVINSSHCGALAPYGLTICGQGMIGLVLTHSDSMVLPHGARVPFCGTNPICITAPGLESHLCLDMATSVVPWNTIMNAALENVPLLPGWAVDRNGNDTTCAQEVNAVYPAAGYKGSGLGLMIDVLCAMLGGGPYGPDISKMYGDLSQRRRLGGLVGAIDIGRFIPLDHFRSRVAEMMSRLNHLPAAEGQRVLYPGQPEEECRRQRLAEGVPVGVELVAILRRLAGESGLDDRVLAAT